VKPPFASIYSRPAHKAAARLLASGSPAAATLPPFASPSRPSSPPRTRRARRPSRKEKPETPRRRTHARRRTATGPRCALAHRYTRGRPHQHGRPWNVASQGLLCLHGQRQEAVRRGSAGAAPLHARGVCHPALPSPQQPPAVSMRGGHRGLASPRRPQRSEMPLADLIVAHPPTQHPCDA
jgi:hypothetical protein